MNYSEQNQRDLLQREYSYTIEYFYSNKKYDENYYEENKFDMIVLSKNNSSSIGASNAFFCYTYSASEKICSYNRTKLGDIYHFSASETYMKTNGFLLSDNISLRSELFSDFLAYLINMESKGKYIYYTIVKPLEAVSDIENI